MRQRSKPKRTKWGAINAKPVISNPAERNKNWEGDFLANTGATDSLAPKQHRQSIDVSPEGQSAYELAGSNKFQSERNSRSCRIHRGTHRATVEFGKPDVELLLGLTSLELVGIKEDSRNQTLKKSASGASQVAADTIKIGERKIA